MHKNPVRIGLRGFGGLLGSRFVEACSKIPDFCLTVGIMRRDATLTRLIERCEFTVCGKPPILAQQMYLDEADKIIDEVNQISRGTTIFLPLRELDLNASCDVVVDAASAGRNHSLQSHYQNFAGPVIYQDGEFPRGRLISPPLVAKTQAGNRFRQGGCFLSGVVPALAAISDMFSSVRIQLVMQDDGRESDFMIGERVNTFRVRDDYRPRMQDELSQLFPGKEMIVESVIQIPSMLHYAVSLTLRSDRPFAASEIRERLASVPRIRVLPDSVQSTYALNLWRVLDDRIPPILVFGSSIEVENRSTARLKLALYYRTLAVLPNIDAIRILVGDMDPKQAMKQTDKYLGFNV